ncbi:polyhydroxybutyrate depolymerase [Streptomyces cinnabarinus]|uniref:Polyhydroxybutyrate depolymerase n=1 Tax=Streptomyces cinnabarinus TaxID=67287 RepID=A0ABY7KLD9_9ACTN|nr:polyhydroxybutyrate depolymerase [Streptomyces cinnabarinus]WAZ24505.1 polyhydroxybutyrate depolymerase [Streptomyces cinnabarinus]
MLTRGITSLRGPLTAAALITALCLTACSTDSEPESKPGSRGSTAAEKPSPSPKPQKEVPRPGDQSVELDWKGTPRSYKVHAPPGYTPDKRLPLVIAMHPYPGTGEYAELITGLTAKADKENFLVVYPNGYNEGFNALICCGSEDDIGFLRTITDRFTDKWNADPDRIYATGISNGGDMSFKAAVELHDTFAAIAPVSGGYIGSALEDKTYVPESPVSVITFIGELDKYYDEFDAGTKAWEKRLRCERGSPKKVEKQTTRTTAQCADGSQVVSYRLSEMFHSWPGGSNNDMAFTDTTVNATDLMWEFFRAHPKKRT